MGTLNTIPEAQAEIEVLNGGEPSKALKKLEGQLRKFVMKFRDLGSPADANETCELIEGLAKANNFKTIRVHYQTITPAPDGHTMFVYEATLDKFHCFIYVREMNK